MFDITFLTTLGLVFLVTLVGSYLRSVRKDPCLKSFEGFHVTLKRASGKIVWGIMELESTGMELRYRDYVQDEGHLESSYILYASEYHDIETIFRFVDELTDENKKKRMEDIDRSFHPGFVVRLGRRLRNFIGTASDSLSEIIGLMVGRAKKPAGRYIDDKGEAYLNRLGANLIGAAGGVYDPLLERYVGKKVVVEIMEDDEVHEHVGIFKNYSPDFIEVLDVQFPQRQAVKIGPDGCNGQGCMQIEVDNGTLHVQNPHQQPILLHSLLLDGEERLLNVVADAGGTVELHPNREFEKGELRVRVIRELDMIVPRTRSLVRHRAETENQSFLPELIFDMGYLLKPSARSVAQEERLRAQLAENPNSALAAANLGGLLMQRNEFDEAEKWLQHALRMYRSLPDNGRRAEMQLRELRRRQGRAEPVMDQSLVVALAGSRPVRSDSDMTANSRTPG